MARDYVLNEQGDLKIENGDFVFGDATRDNERLMLLAEKGEWKHSPLSGVGIRSFLDDEHPTEFEREVRRQFGRDGAKVETLSYQNEELKLTTIYA